jgi:Homeodomain-like domain
MANTTQERRDAIRRYLQGESASAICRSLGRTRYWFYKWLKRYDPANPSWFQDHSRIPHQVGHKTSLEVEQLVCQLLFFRPQPFGDLAHIREELPRFETFHNTQHRYAKLGSRTHWEVHTAAKRRLLSRRFALHQQGLLWREGRVSFTRLTDD